MYIQISFVILNPIYSEQIAFQLYHWYLKAMKIQMSKSLINFSIIFNFVILRNVKHLPSSSNMGLGSLVSIWRFFLTDLWQSDANLWNTIHMNFFSITCNCCKLLSIFSSMIVIITILWAHFIQTITTLLIFGFSLISIHLCLLQ